MSHTGNFASYSYVPQSVFVCCGQMPISQNRMISKKKLIALLHLRKPIVKSFEADQNETVLVFPDDEHLSN